MAQWAGLNFRRPFVIPPEAHIKAEADHGMEAAAAVAGATWSVFDQVAEWSAYDNLWAKAMKCGTEL